jgi:hypothetical protein
MNPEVKLYLYFNNSIACYRNRTNTIYLGRLLKEDMITYVIDHEYLHSILFNLISHESSYSLDNITNKAKNGEI